MELRHLLPGRSRSSGSVRFGLLSWSRRSFFLLGIVGNLAIIVLYLLTRTARIPFFGPQAGEVEGVGPLDISASVSEVALVAVLAALSRGWGLSREGWSMVVLGIGVGKHEKLGAHDPRAL